VGKFSVACNFDPALLDRLDGFPVYEIYGKLTVDELGGGRPSFYLPQVGRSELAEYVGETRRRGISFNYLLNSSATDNTEYTTRGQRKLNRLLDWLADVGVDSVTVANVYLLRLLKRRRPGLKVRISSHRFTDTPRKIRFWVDNGADFIVISEVSIHREFAVLRAMREAAGDVELQLIVNNWCRQDCAIAGNHAVALSAASRSHGSGFPLDYCSIICNWIRLSEPVNYIRANWIRPEDLHLYEAMGYRNFKIVERNTPTQILVERLRAYANGRHEGNLLDMVQNYAYPEEKLGETVRGAHSFGRFLRYFFRPGRVNLFKFRKVDELGRLASMLYPLRGENPVFIDNRALDGFMDRFRTEGCQASDCATCGYCDDWARKSVRIDPEWRESVEPVYRDLLAEIEGGGMWEPYTSTLRRALATRRSEAT
jgi:collagenase-like PrtC family protease